MDRQKLEKKIAYRTGLQETDVRRMIDVLIEIIGSELQGGRSVEISGFGTFLANLRPAGNYTDLVSGVTVYHPDELKPYFRATKSFKKRINTEWESVVKWNDSRKN